MSIYEMLSLLCEDDVLVAVYDMGLECEAQVGEAREVMDGDFCDWEVLSFDLCRDDPRGVLLVLNIDSTED